MPKDTDGQDPEVEETQEPEEEQDPQEPEQEEGEIEESVEALRARLKEREKKLREVNAESKQRRLALEALEKEKKEREEAELSEKEKLEKQVSEQKAELERIQKEKRDLALENSFEKTTQALKLSFVNDKARSIALHSLDLEKVGEDFDGMEEAIKDLLKDQAFLFGKTDQNNVISDGSRKSKVTPSTVTKNKVEEMRRRIPPL